VLGEIDEPLGPQRDIYRSVGERIGEITSRAIFIVRQSEKYRLYATGATRGGLPRHELLHYPSGLLPKAIESLSNDLQSGDVVLIKGGVTQRLDRVVLLLTGRTVRCNISHCNARLRCEYCPMLEREWKGFKGVI
jgi:UDP-N-acetylmuramyl pentapeptide synthase